MNLKTYGVKSIFLILKLIFTAYLMASSLG